MGQPRFDFNKAVAEARRDYPEETVNTLFISLADMRHDEVRKQLKEWVKEALEALGYNTRYIKGKWTLRRNFSAVMKEIETGGYCLSLGDKNLIGIKGTDEVLNDPQFAFDHELGHLV